MPTKRSHPWQDWTSPDLLLSQTCGLPFRAKLHDQLTLVAAPVWDGPIAMKPGRYVSVVVARTGDPRGDITAFDGATLAYNDPLSQSGWGLMMQLCKARSIAPGAGLMTGSHRASALAVVKSKADFAAIDAVTWYHLQAHNRWTRELRVIAQTASSPALPFVTAKPELAPALRAALQHALSDAGDDIVIQSLFFASPGVIAAKRDDYMAIPLPPSPADIFPA